MIVFTTKYGSSRRAAHALGTKLDQKVISLEEFNPELAQKEDKRLVLVMPLYAGSLFQARKMASKLKTSGIGQFILVTVGLANPQLPENAASIAQTATQCFDGFQFDLFSVRGAMDYALLNPKDRLMMAALKKMIEKKPDEGENASLLASYGKAVDLYDEKEIVQTASQIQQSAFYCPLH